ncbi:MAG TPA: DNA replication/repair protein RecF [Candidatus Saccharimonadia bacterium]|nr:DNA replication/repair protein RecF [Candidatus Saccharimonadia bacterium]
MMLRELELTNFRSYETARFALHPDVTLVVGPNASGKTNLLEGLYVLASTRSFRAKDRDLVRHGEDYFRIVGRTEDTEYALGYGDGEKKITHDGVKRTLVGHVGQIQVTLFEPTDLELVAGAPEGRRRYLDFLLSQTDRAYLRTLQQYRRVLKQRNALLDGFDVGRIRDQIFGWDVKLAELAVEIYGARGRLLAVLAEATPLLYRDIAGESVEVAFEYLPSVTGVYEEQFLETLARNLTRDLAAGFTTIGPHREDFKIHFKNNDITRVASRGETRTLVLAMKLAELGYAEERTGIRPLLLLDDVFSELDRQRRGYLLNRLEGYQTLVTTTDADAITKEFRTAHQLIATEAAAHA